MRLPRTTLLLAAFGALAIAAAEAPAPSPGAPAGRYTVGTGTVADGPTGLTWQRAPGSATYSWISALSYCRNLRLDATTGWRLPSVKELQTLVDDRAFTGATVDAAAFPGVAGTFYWSSTPTAADPARAWGLDLSNGTAVHRPTGNGYSVICVR